MLFLLTLFESSILLCCLSPFQAPYMKGFHISEEFDLRRWVLTLNAPSYYKMKIVINVDLVYTSASEVSSHSNVSVHF